MPQEWQELQIHHTGLAPGAPNPKFAYACREFDCELQGSKRGPRNHEFARVLLISEARMRAWRARYCDFGIGTPASPATMIGTAWRQNGWGVFGRRHPWPGGHMKAKVRAVSDIDMEKFRLRRFVDRLIDLDDVEVHPEPVPLTGLSTIVE